MILTIKYLQERHQYWAQQLFDTKIFDIKVKLIPLEIHYGVKTYNGVFRWRGDSEKIILYPPVADIDEKWVDNVLVHEMIHQYIHDMKIIVKSSHGNTFKALMYAINRTFKNLNISVTEDRTKYLPNEEGNELHTLCVLRFSDVLFICKVKSNKVSYFNNLILSNKMRWKSPLEAFGWYQSKHNLFANQRASQTRLSGKVFEKNSLPELIEKYKLQKINVVEDL